MRSPYFCSRANEELQRDNTDLPFVLAGTKGKQYNVCIYTGKFVNIVIFLNLI